MAFRKDRKNSKINFSWQTFSITITAICTILGLILKLFFKDPIIPFNSTIDFIQNPPQSEISINAEELSNVYRQYWKIYGIDIQPQFVMMQLINNSQFYLANVVVEFTLIVDNDSPLKTIHIIGCKINWIKKIPFMKQGPWVPIPVIDISPFYSGQLSWKITANDPNNSNIKIVLDEQSIQFNNSNTLCFKTY